MRRLHLLLSTLFIFVVSGLIGCNPLSNIPPGYVGVEYQIPGLRGEGGGFLETNLNPGQHVLDGYKSCSVVLDTRPKIWEMPVTVRMSDELNVDFNVKLTTKVKSGMGGDLIRSYATSGKKKGSVTETLDYHKIIGPVFETVTRSRLSEEPSMNIASKRQEVADDILIGIVAQLSGDEESGVEAEPLLKYLDFQRVTIGNIDYPEAVNAAIERRAEAQAKLEEKEHELETARKDSEIKRVEAEGIAAAQAIIDKTLTREYLTHEWIEALERTAQTENTTIVYVPTGTDGLPVFKGIH
jgi:regulator of protease activity HflC (stomatin/prohibitin superfamily)